MNYAKLLEISSFFTWHIFLEVGKTQDMSNKILQTLGDAQNLWMANLFQMETGATQGMRLAHCSGLCPS